MKNKTGSVEIVVFVFLVVALVLFAGYKFYTSSGKVETRITGARFIENLYFEKKIAENYIEKIGKDVIEKNGEIDFKENFKTEFSKYDFAANSLKELQKIISEERFNIFAENNILEVVINSWEVEDSIEKIQIKYVPKISVKFDLE